MTGPTPIPPTPASTHTLKLPRHRQRAIARTLLNHQRPLQQPTPGKPPIKIVCISDTHNARPALPPGDLLIHAGDLTEWGTYTELQAQLTWLASQPHRHKVVIAGNHDTLLDPAFLGSHQATFPVKPGESAAELDFTGLVYLENSGATLSFPSSSFAAGEPARVLRIWGSPLTPVYCDAAFQYSREKDVWEKFHVEWERGGGNGVDVLVTHGPAWGRLDGVRRAGCPFLLRAVARLKPRVHVCGHIHVGAGREVVRCDAVRRVWEEVEMGWRGWGGVVEMGLRVAWERVEMLLGGRSRDNKKDRVTEVVNAAVVGVDNEICREAVVVYL